MSTLSDLLQTRAPMIWCVSDEPLRVVDTAARVSERPVFRMDVMLGLLTFKDGQWKTVLIDDPEEPELPKACYDMQQAISYVLSNKGVMVIENAHDKIERLISFMNHVSEVWQRGFTADELEKFPPSFLLISHSDKIPPELARMVTKVNFALPTEEELASVTRHVVQMAELKMPNRNAMARITRAGVGMAEFEFVHATANSLLSNGEIDSEYINSAKLAILEAGGTLSVRVPSITMADIGGLDRAKQVLERITYVWKNPTEAAALKIDPLRRMLLIGVSGSGKSALAEATASGLGLELAKFGVSQMMSKWVGESEANMRKAFDQVKAMAPLCLWIDEMGRDLSGSASSGSVDGGTTDRVHGEFLQGLQELPSNVFLVCAANRVDDLPPEMLRSDRFDKIMFVGFPTAMEREEIFRIHLGDTALDYDLSALAEATPFFTGAEIKALVREVRFEVSAATRRPPVTEDIIAYCPKMKGRIWNNHRPAVVDMYRKALEQWDWASSSQLEEAHTVLGSAERKPQVERPVPQLSPGGGNIFR